MVKSTAMGLEPVTWGDLRDCDAALGLDLDPWDYEALRLMSAHFLGALHHGAEIMAMGPLEEDEAD